MRFPNCREKAITSVGILRMLVLQTLQINPVSLQKGVILITVTHLRDAADEKDWLGIPDRALVDIPHVFVILDSDLLNHAI
ncbi:hypothetical protein K469DRAFT_705508, partial [Zopfia rhizophila CBS 207.26]